MLHPATLDQRSITIEWPAHLYSLKRLRKSRLSLGIITNPITLQSNPITALRPTNLTSRFLHQPLDFLLINPRIITTLTNHCNYTNPLTLSWQQTIVIYFGANFELSLCLDLNTLTASSLTQRTESIIEKMEKFELKLQESKKIIENLKKERTFLMTQVGKISLRNA